MPTGQYERKKKVLRKPQVKIVLQQDEMKHKAIAFNSLAVELYLKGLIPSMPEINWDKLKEF